MRFQAVLDAADLVMPLPDSLIALLDHLAGITVELLERIFILRLQIVFGGFGLLDDRLIVVTGDRALHPTPRTPR